MPDDSFLILLSIVVGALAVILGQRLWSRRPRGGTSDRAAMRRLDQSLPAVDARPIARPAGHAAWVALTPRERDVARLVAAGKTNAEIGGQLFISPRTAGTHVSSILRKFDLKRRAQLIAALHDILPYEDRGGTGTRN